MDKKLENEAYLSFHPCENTSTLCLKREDVVELLKENGREIVSVDLEFQGKKKELKPKPEQSKNVLALQAKKSEDFGKWYSEIIIKGDLLDYYVISGCYILKPNSYFIWESIQRYLDIEFKKLGVKNCYFPMFVTNK